MVGLFGRRFGRRAAGLVEGGENAPGTGLKPREIFFTGDRELHGIFFLTYIFSLCRRIPGYQSVNKSLELHIISYR